MPAALAMAAAVQCVVSPGGSALVRATTRSITGWASGGMRGGRVLSRSRPSTPACMKRSCQRQTTDLLLPVRRMIVAVPRPSAVSSTIRQRQTCFCGLLRSATTASRRARSAAFTVTMIPLRIPETRTPASPWESSNGLNCQVGSTSGTSAGDLIPIGTVDYSAYLIKAKAYGPQVLINVMGGGDQVNSLKQFVQFGLEKQMAVGGTLFELESLRAVPNEARIGWWTMEWWWDQPNVPEVQAFNAAMKQRTGKAATARNWFGYVSVQTVALLANQEKTLDAVKLARALSGFKLPPEVALQPGSPEYRAGDHELMSTVFVGEAHPPQGDADNMFTVRSPVPGDKAAGPAEGTGCKLQWPA